MIALDKQDSDNQLFWFAARVKNCQEFSIRKALEDLDIASYLPTRFITRELKYRRKRVEVPVIRNLIFVHTTKEKACSASNEFGIRIYYIKDMNTRSILVIPDKQMQDFMLMMKLASENVIIDDCTLTVGTRVQVIKGEFCGIEGEFVSVASRAHVMVRIPQILSAMIRIPRSSLKKIE